MTYYYVELNKIKLTLVSAKNHSAIYINDNLYTQGETVLLELFKILTKYKGNIESSNKFLSHDGEKYLSLHKNLPNQLSDLKQYLLNI